MPPPPPLPPPPAAAPLPGVPDVTPGIQKVDDRPAHRATPPPTETPPPPATPPAPSDPGGGPVVAMDSPARCHGQVPVGGRPAHGGPRRAAAAGHGHGSRLGSGAGDVAAPVSVATIKQRAMPKGDYGYFDASKDYPAEAKQLGIEGAIRVRLIVDDRGTVTRATLLNKLGHGLDELALRAARKIQFAPARDTERHPVASVVVWTFNMTLPK